MAQNQEIYIYKNVSKDSSSIEDGARLFDAQLAKHR